MIRYIFLLIGISFLTHSVQAQEVWTLQKCIEHAKKNNHEIRSVSKFKCQY